jgi:1-acyl-sn-glycerol-3-phosphate acyltransferase
MIGKKMRFKNYQKQRAFISKIYFALYHRLTIRGIENIPRGAALIAANHNGGWDLDNVALTHCGHPTREIQVLIWAKYHYMNEKWGKYFIAGGIPLWLKWQPEQWNYLNPYLHKNGSRFPGLVGIFPEGNSGLFARRHLIREFFPGVVRIAIKYKVPIVPTATYGFHKAVPILKEYKQEHGPPDPIVFVPIPLPFRLFIEYGKPFELQEYYGQKLSKEEETWIANKIIRPKIAELREKYTKVNLMKVNLKMKKPRISK